MNHSFEETGTVVQIGGDRAEVRVVPLGGCDRCAASGFCNWTGKREKVVIVVNTIGAQPGDTVVISRKIKAGTTSALLLFGLPVVLMLLGVLTGGILLKHDIWAGVLLGLGLFIGIMAIKLIDRKRGKLGTGLPVIVRRVLIPKPEGSQDEKNHIGSVGHPDHSQLP